MRKYFIIILLMVAFVFGKQAAVEAGNSIYVVSGTTNYLALRNAKAYARENEIAELYNGETVEVLDTSDATYWYVYSSKCGKSGYVNKNYLVYQGSTSSVSVTSYPVYTVSGTTNYLALRNAKAYARENEIGKLYNGESVEVIDSSDATYWYVYSSKTGQYGYVNKDYLVYQSGTSRSVSTSNTYVVTGTTNYLALRNAKAYARGNEIGELYNGETVDVVDSSDSEYWYVYSSKYGKYGYVNKNYLAYQGKSSNVVSGNKIYTVTGTKNYLALRSAKAYARENEIGQLYNGEAVELLDSSDSDYWYVYSSKYNMNGYVNKNYLK